MTHEVKRECSHFDFIWNHIWKETVLQCLTVKSLLVFEELLPTLPKHTALLCNYVRCDTVSSFSHCAPVLQQTPPECALVFLTCLFAGRGFHPCYSSHRRCPDGPSEERWQTPSGMQLLCTHHRNYRDCSHKADILMRTDPVQYTWLSSA